MNREFMRERLEAFLTLCQEYDGIDRANPGTYTDDQRRIASEMATESPAVKEILKRLNPDLVEGIIEPQYLGGVHDSMRSVQQALGLLRDLDVLAIELAPDAPVLAADGFHPHVWQAAAALWDTAKYRVAVQQACVSLSAHIAKKADSHLSDRELVNEVLSPKLGTKPGQVRLHLPQEGSQKSWQSQQEGLHMIAQGAFAAIRNVATHTHDDWTEQEALEALAVLSWIARGVENAELVEPVPGTG